MKFSEFFRRGVIAVTCSGMLLGQALQAAGPSATVTGGNTPEAAAAPQVRVQDVVLQEQGVLKGTVLDANGTGVAKSKVAIVRQGQVVSLTETDAQGHFTVAKLTGGVHEIHTPTGVTAVRLWAPRMAPPAAQQLAMVEPSTIVRGQGGSALGFLANPWVLAGVVAAAIAIPLALDDDDAS